MVDVAAILEPWEVDPRQVREAMYRTSTLVRCEYPIRSRREGLCRLPVILVNEAAEYISSPDGTMSCAGVEGNRRALHYALMWARLIVVCDVGNQDPPQVRLVEDQEVVEALERTQRSA